MLGAIILQVMDRDEKNAVKVNILSEHVFSLMLTILLGNDLFDRRCSA